MINESYKFKESQNLTPINIENKEQYYRDLDIISNSWVGRLDAQVANTFIQESVQLIINSLFLFEKGYFDCAFYSLRQSLEISTTIVYLIELDSHKREIELEKWKKQSRFPMYGQMLKFLSEKGNVFSDMKSKMENYFFDLQLIKERLNKYVHKQGFNTFYVSRNHTLVSNKSNSTIKLLDEFKNYVEKCIGAISVFRLAIDPYPVLLMDESIYYRIGNIITEPYSQEFINRYIGTKAIEEYMETKAYLDLYRDIMREEKQLPSVADIIKHQYIDKAKFNEILSQVHLLSKVDLIAFVTAMWSEKVAKIHFYDGIHFYFTSTKSARHDFSFSSSTFTEIKKLKLSVNIKYDEAFLTFIKLKGEEFFIEHNELFLKEELEQLYELL